MPFDDVLYNALLQNRQGAKVELYGGRRVYPQCGCCVSGNTVGVYKDPVAILELSTTEVCEFTPVSVRFEKSFSATSTIQTWEVDWGDGYTTNGAWPPVGSIWHPAGGYDFAGVYTITLKVTDLLGAFDYDAQDINVIVCPPLYPTLPGIIVGAYDYGPAYTLDLYATPPVWVDMKTAQLVVAGAKRPHCLRYVRDRMHGNQWQVFMGTECGIYRYRYFSAANPTWGNWSQVVDVPTMVTMGGVAFTTSAVWEIDDCLDAPGHMYACFGANIPGIPDWNGFGIMYTSDYFDTVDRILYVAQGFWGPGTFLGGQWRCGLSYVQGTSGSTAYISSLYDGIAGTKYVWKTTDHGASWPVSMTNCGHNEVLVHTPYIDDSNKDTYVYTTANLVGVSIVNHYSANGGAGWAGMGQWNKRPMRLAMSPNRGDLLHYIGWSNWGEWRTSTMTHTNLNDLGVGSQGRDVLVTDRDDDEEVLEAVLVGIGAGGGWIHLWDPTQTATLPAGGNKNGNINTLTGGKHIYSVARVNYGFPVRS